MHIPEDLAEPLVSSVRLCRNANEGDRLDKIKDQLAECHPELSEQQLTQVIREGANLLARNTEQNDPTLAREAKRNARRRGK